jgi:hypothetical protein
MGENPWPFFLEGGWPRLAVVGKTSQSFHLCSLFLLGIIRGAYL